MGATDAELLNEYARSKSDAAFAALAARYGPLVYAAALRQVRRADLADDVTQAVWIVLVQRTPLAAGSHLAGWLLTTTRYCAKDALRKQARRAHHEHEAAAMKPLVSPPPDATAADDDHLAKHLDEALSRLRPQASAAVALRFLQDQPLADVARATGMTVDAAQKVVARALPQLRRWLTQRGVLLSSTAVLTDAMLRLPRAGNIAAPISPAAASPNSIAIAKGAIHMMRLTVVKTASLATAAAFLLTAAGAGVVMMNSATAAAPPKPAAAPPTAVEPAASSKPAVAADNLVGFNSPFLQLVGCRIKQTLALQLPTTNTQPVQVNWYEQQSPEIEWTIEPALASKTKSYRLLVALDTDPASAKPTDLDAAARDSATGPNEPGDYTVHLTAIGADGSNLADASAHVVVKPLPYTQISINDLQPDGSIRFASVQQQINENVDAIQNGGFINSDFVHLEKMFDDSGAPLQFTSAHKGQIFQYRYRLQRPIEPGQPLMLANAGNQTGMIKKQGAINSYVMDHSPNSSSITRRIELHRLPPGAMLVSITPADLPHKVVDGCEQIFEDTIIPAGGHNLVAYRYRLSSK